MTTTYGVSLSKGSVSVEIKARKIDVSYDSQMNTVQLPVQFSEQDLVSNNVKVIDLKRFNFTISVTGLLWSDSTSTATEKATALFSETVISGSPITGANGKVGMMRSGGAITLTYRGRTYSGGIMKASYTDDASRDELIPKFAQVNPSDSPHGTRGLDADKLEIMFTFVVGTVQA